MILFLTMQVNINNKVWRNRCLQFNCSHRWLVHAFCIHHLQQKHIQVIKLNYKKKWNLHKKQLSCKKKVQPMQKKTAWKKLWNPRWQPRSGCNGRIMAKILITTMVNLVPIPWRRQHKFVWNFAIKFCHYPTITTTTGLPPWIAQLFHAVFLCMGRTFFYSLAVFVCIC